MARELKEVLGSFGAETVAISLIESRLCQTKIVGQILSEIESYTWMVFTSSNGVDLFFDYLRKEEIDLRKLMHMKFAVIGRKTGEALKRHGFFCDFVPSRFIGEELAREWIPALTGSDRVALMRAKDGSPVLTERLAETGIKFTDAPLYETWVDERRGEELNRIMDQVDYVVMASSSAVKAFCQMIENRDQMKAKVISIGPATTKTAEERGLAVWRTAGVYTSEGIGAAILADRVNPGEKF